MEVFFKKQILNVSYSVYQTKML